MEEPFRNPGIDWAALSPELILLGGASVVLLVALLGALQIARAAGPGPRAGREGVGE